MLTLARPYVSDLFSYRRRRTREVMVGNVGVGGDNPIRVQSMTTTLTKDIDATVAQTERLVAAGCEIVRITTPTPNDARCLGPIKERLLAKGIRVPLVADIHFSPMAALVAAEFADKVRVNPGNYTDSRKFAIREYTDEEYYAELARVEERFSPLVLKCKERRVAMRIGTNHGSLSDRIMNRFGDSPEGMVESALEFVRICEKHEYFDLILSMKASNPKVMIAANRLLAARMNELGMEYPFHLGVTEAGNAEDGRIKSAIGIGSLLEDGIGDTIRVSLTEEPEAEIPVAFAIAGRYHDRPQDSRDVPWRLMDIDLGPFRACAGVGAAPSGRPPPQRRDQWPVREGIDSRDQEGGHSGPPLPEPPGEICLDPMLRRDVPWDPYHFERRNSRPVLLGDLPLGADDTVAVITSIDDAKDSSAMARLLRWASPAGKRQPKPDAALIEITDTTDLELLTRFADRLEKWPQARLPLIAAGQDPVLLMDALATADAILLHEPTAFTLPLAIAARDAGKSLVFEARIEVGGEYDDAIYALLSPASNALAEDVAVAIALNAPDSECVSAYRLLVAQAGTRGIDVPIILHVRASTRPLLPESIALGSLLCDGIGDAVVITGMDDSTTLSFNILQAAGTRITKTDYVACPSCGRTLFDLQETTERIKQKTSHLVGVRLAIMGCIVNGPGEMADADFGYVGGAPGQVNLYVGKECVEKGVPAEIADERLVELIKARGKWQEEEIDAG